MKQLALNSTEYRQRARLDSPAVFGSLRISRSRLEWESRDLYRGHFCGACHAMHQFTGRISSLLANYDQTVLGMVLGGLEGSASLVTKPCTALPFRRVSVIELSERSQAYLAAINLALVEAKLIDDVQDEGRWTRRTARWILARKCRLAADKLGELGYPLAGLTELSGRQSRIEARAGSLEEYAGPTAELTGDLFEFAGHLAGRTELADPLRRFGAALGGFIYVWDAWIDRDEDARRKVFNAIARSGSDEAGTARFLRLRLAELFAQLEDLPLGPQHEVLHQLLHSLEDRLDQRFETRRSEAGICEIGEGCCAAIECCECGSSGEGCVCCCSRGSDVCCCLSDSRERSRRPRKVFKGGRRQPTEAEADGSGDDSR